MLSKYYSFKNGNINKISIDFLVNSLKNLLEKKCLNVKVKPIQPGGTLGSFFLIEIDGKTKFVKTYLFGEDCQTILKKEIEILSVLYQTKMEIQIINTKTIYGEISFLLMDYLYKKDNKVEIQEIIYEINQVHYKLQNSDIKVNHSITDIILAGLESVDLLKKKRFITALTYQRCLESIELVQERYIKFPQVLNHGDLSNANIMFNSKNEMIFIDWEDAIMAFPEYDYLYWLTFFSQRKYYSSKVLLNNNIKLDFGIGVMVLIIIIKCAISFYSKSYINNIISFEERIIEVYNKFSVY